jgi:hypothetical protein
VSPFTEKGRPALPEFRIGVAAMPPSAPVKDCELAWRGRTAAEAAPRKRVARKEVVKSILKIWLVVSLFNLVRLNE